MNVGNAGVAGVRRRKVKTKSKYDKIANKGDNRLNETMNEFLTSKQL